MIRLNVSITGAEAAAQTASPGIVFRLQVTAPPARRIHAIVMRCHVRIDARRRSYTADEQLRLYELFGHPSQWPRTLQTVTWGHSAVVVPTFDVQTEAELTVPCTYDLDIAASKYLHAVRDGGIPIAVLFSGTIFSVTHGTMAVDPIPWDLEATYQLPARVWHAAMDRFFGGGAWLRLRRDTIDRLQAFRGRQAVTGWDDTIDRLLEAVATERT